MLLHDWGVMGVKAVGKKKNLWKKNKSFLLFTNIHFLHIHLQVKENEQEQRMMVA